jgi:hypothetical protein
MKDSAAPWIARPRRPLANPIQFFQWSLRRRLGRASGAISAHAASPSGHWTAPLADRPARPIANAISMGVAIGACGTEASATLALTLSLTRALPLPLALGGLTAVLSECRQAGEKKARGENTAYRFHVTTSATR